MSKPKRIQRKREKGWKMPAGTVYVGRPSKWGNDFRVSKYKHGFIVRNGNVGLNGHIYETKLSASKVCVKVYAQNIRQRVIYKDIDLSELAGKDLACWCPLDQPCHADVLIELANSNNP